MSQNYLSSAERRAMAILDAYGSRPAHWPDEERQATLVSITRSASLQRYQAQLEDLDMRIESAQAASLPSAHAVQALQQRILANLPEVSSTPKASAWHRLLDWLKTPRHAMALSVLTILAIILATPHSPSFVASRQTGNNSTYAAWSWYDITGQELPAAKHQTVALSMTDFINLEIGQDGN